MRIFLLLIISYSAYSQTKLPEHKNSFFHLGLVPGISTSEIQPQYQIEQVSLFLFSGYSAATEGFAFSLIQNLNTSFSKGLFIAGFANHTGINNKQNEENNKIENLEATLEGLQISGFLNYVLDNSFGSQITGGINITQGGFFGLQFAGISNVVNKYTFGGQISGIVNISRESINGFQLAVLSNQTKGQLEGIQIGAFNIANSIHGKNSYEINSPTGFQFGLFNKSLIMNGFQIGLINIGEKMQGTQIGLINIAGKGSTHLTRDGTTIGLLNISSSFYIQSYTDEKLFLNYELGTGTFKNSRVQENSNKYFFSTITYSSKPIFQQKQTWMLGLGLFKMWAPRSISRGEYFFSSPGIQIFHLNPTRKALNEFNPLLRLRYMYGRKMIPKNNNFYLFASITGNTTFKEFSENETSLLKKNKIKFWPGFQFGITLKN